MNETPSSPSPEVKPLPPAPALPFTMKAHLAEYSRRLGMWRYILGFLISLFILFRFGPVAWIAAIAAITGIILLFLYFMAHRSVAATAEGLEYTNGFNKKRTVAYADIPNSKVFVSYIEPGFGIAPRVIIMLAGKPFVSLSGLYWKYEDIDLLLATLQEKKVGIEFYQDLVISKTIKTQFPTALLWYERHPVVFALLLTVLIIVAAFAYAFYRAVN